MPKTIRNEFDKKLTYNNLMKSHILSRKGKGYRAEVILFNLKQEEYIIWLLEQLQTGKYRHGGYKIFYVTEPKLRKIEKSRYIDRIVHRFVVDNFLQEYFVKSFIPTSFACIKKRGTHRAVLTVQNSMKHCQRIWGSYYILKMDVRKFFDNINKDILYNILKRKGLPIGNYTSQIYANIYLNELDQYVKHQLHCRYYYRYMDDAVILTKTKLEAKEILNKIHKFLKENLELELNEKTQIFKSKQGVNFCGYKINEYRIKIRDRGKRKLKKKVKELKYKIRIGEINSKEAKKYLCGHIGYIKYANVKNLTDKVLYNPNNFVSKKLKHESDLK